MSNLPQGQRRQFVGASEAGSLFSLDLLEAGEKVYETRYELWARKSGKLPRGKTEHERMEWGQRLEAGIARGFAARFGLRVRKVRRYVRHPTVDGMGCSPDYEIVGHPLGPGVLEIKNVDRSVYRDWPRVEDADDPDFVRSTGVEVPRRRREPPLRLQLQVQHQLACYPRRRWGVLAMLVGGNELVPVVYPRVEIAVRRIEEEVPLFWAEVDSGVAPPIHWSADAGTVAKLYGHADARKVLNARGDAELLVWAREHHELGRGLSDASDRREVLKAKMLQRVGEASKVYLAQGYTIHAPRVSGREVHYHQDPYRQFRVHQRKR